MAAAIVLVSVMLAVTQAFNAPAFTLSGKHIVLTGAAGEVPTRVARLLLAAGANLTLIAHVPADTLHFLVTELSEHRQCAQQQIRWVSADMSDADEASEVLHRAIHQQAGRVHALLCLEALTDDPASGEAPLSLSPSVQQGHASVVLDRAESCRSVLRVPLSAPITAPPMGSSEQKIRRDGGEAALQPAYTPPTPMCTPVPPPGASLHPPLTTQVKGLSGLLVEQFGRQLRRRHYAAVHALTSVVPYMQSQPEGGRIVLTTGWAQPMSLSPEPMVNALTMSLCGVLAAPLREQRVFISTVQPTWQTDAERSAATVVATLRNYRFVACASSLWSLAGGSAANGIWGTPATSFWALVAELMCLGVVRVTAAAALAWSKLRRRKKPTTRCSHLHAQHPHGWA
eukprot:TRINITY_DN880_c0_g1_i1.p1 TRINITY_DN880_c0_g1~~TRINITY_DN880_c0_g1_i1.p1  ORF type:complete len:436 (+),score=73.01 TRINITY_DN880_c0_g1_i1:113-1309(+)